MGLALTQSAPVSAQSEGGEGIRLGDFELHPGVGSEVGYLTNVFYSDKEEDSFAFRISPSLYLSSLSAERRGGAPPPAIMFKGGASGSFQTFFSTAARDSIGANLGLDVTINPERPVSFVISELFQRSATPFTESGLAGTGGNAKAPEFGRNQNGLGGHLMLETPGGLLKGSVGYKWNEDWFDDAVFNLNKNTIHVIDQRASWEFLPKTALFQEASLAIQEYREATNGVTALDDNKQVSTRAGINGALTSTLAGTIAVGYTAGFTDLDRDFESITLSVEGRYVPSETAEFAIGYNREFSPAFQGAFVERNRFYTRARAMLGKQFLIGAKAGVELLDFGADPSQGNRERSDVRIFADSNAEYRFLEWLAVTGQVGFLADLTDFKFMLPATTTAPASTDDAEFTAFEAWLGLRAFY